MTFTGEKAVYILLGVCLFTQAGAQSMPSQVISGYVNEKETGKPIPGTTIFIQERRQGVTTDREGFYSITLPAGTYTLSASHIGYLRFQQKITLPPSLFLNNITLSQDTQLLEEVTVRTDAPDQQVKQVALGVTQLPIRNLVKMPALLGEVDVVKSLLMLPGVTTVGEGATGINVRGGSIDQNLVLLDDMPIYNSSHLMGFFSVFNPDAVRDVTLQKGSLPARYGGRTSAVLDVRTKEPDAEKLRLSGGVGFVSNRLGIEGPAGTRKLTFLADARLAVNSFLFRLAPFNIRDTKAHFYDVTTKVKYLPDERNTFYASVYASNDNLLFSSDSLLSVDVAATRTGFDYQTTNGSLKWLFAVNNRLTLSLTGVLSRYRSATSVPDSGNAFRLQAEILSKTGKAELVYQARHHRVSAGLQAMYYSLLPNTLTPGSVSNLNPVRLASEQGLEAAVFAEDEITLTTTMAVVAGIRYSQFLYLGPAEIRTYLPDKPRRPEYIQERHTTDAGRIAGQYGGPEPRLAFRWSLKPDRSLKVAYTKSRQYLQLVTNTTAALPTSRWKLSDTHIKPQLSDQVSGGYFHNAGENTWEISAELYYRWNRNAIDYRDGAKLLLNDTPETELLQGRGRAYGLEVMVKKSKGFLTGWASYAYTRTELLINGLLPVDQVNNGVWYPANYDKPHSVNLLGIYRPSRTFTCSANFTYSTGRPMTVPYAKGQLYGVPFPIYLDRNQQRIPDYHRLDLSFTWEKNPAGKTNWWYSWNFALYNVYARKNAFSVFYKFNSYAESTANKLSIFGSVIPSLTYNFKL